MHVGLRKWRDLAGGRAEAKSELSLQKLILLLMQIRGVLSADLDRLFPLLRVPRVRDGPSSSLAGFGLLLGAVQRLQARPRIIVHVDILDVLLRGVLLLAGALLGVVQAVSPGDVRITAGGTRVVVLLFLAWRRVLVTPVRVGGSWRTRGGIRAAVAAPEPLSRTLSAVVDLPRRVQGRPAELKSGLVECALPVLLALTSALGSAGRLLARLERVLLR